MSRVIHSRADASGHQPMADKRFVSHKGAAIDTLDDVERQLLEPVARYLAILREWSLERRSQEPEAGPPSEQP